MKELERLLEDEEIVEEAQTEDYSMGDLVSKMNEIYDILNDVLKSKESEEQPEQVEEVFEEDESEAETETEKEDESEE